MDSKRQEKFNSLIQRDLGEIFQQLSRDVLGGAFITVSGVKVSPDLGYARVYLSFYNVGNKEEKLNQVRSYSREIRKQLANRIRKQVRKIPELEFFVDDSLDYVQKMEEVFKKLHEDDGDKERK
jgi:ribosome-binding factor A